MNAILLLFLLGVVLLAFEVITPGAILGILGTLAMIGGCALSFYRYGESGGWIAVGAALLLIGAAFYLEFVVLPKTRAGKKMFLHRSIDETSQNPIADRAAVVGKACEAITALAPTGYVILDGQRYEAWSQEGFVAKGAALRVTGLDNFRLIVTSNPS